MLKMSKLPTFREFVPQFKWARLIDDKNIEKHAMKIFQALKNKNDVAKNPMNDKISDIIIANTSKSRRGNIKDSWKGVKDKIKALLSEFSFYEFVDPRHVRRSDIDDNTYIALNKDYDESNIVRKKSEPLGNSFKLKDSISDYDVSEPIVKTAEEIAKEEKAIRKKAVAKATREIVDNFEKKHGEKSVEEQIKNTVTKVAKNKQLMDLSKEQLRDYLRDAYEIYDENALNNMMNAVVAKRAELLANKQLKQEELTEIDISKLQEQSQRDFEKKLQDQNLRYILPAQIEKRERLVQNRLNPELLKGGY